ncbi:uncharacterized protein J3R85_009387 [Psidium guajava]|nr:uncharacterized protein J3R85_009387 [Psidium guajava]
MFGLGIAELAFRSLFCCADAEVVMMQHDTPKLMQTGPNACEDMALSTALLLVLAW